MTALKYLNKYFYKYRIRFFLGIFFVALSNFFAVFSAPFVRKTIDYIQVVILNSGITASEANKKLLYYGLVILGMAFISGLFTFLMRQTLIVMSRLIEYDLKNEIYQHYQQLDLSFYKRNNTGDLMNRISEDVSRVRMYLGPALMYMLNTICIFILVIFQMIHVNATLTLYVLLPLPILSVTIYYVSHIINKRSTLVQKQLSKLSTIAQETFSGIRILKSYNREEYFQNEFKKESNIYREKHLELIKADALFQPFIILLIGLSILSTVYIGGIQAIDGKVSLGNIAEFIIYVNKLAWPVTSLGMITSLIQRAAASQKRINEFLETEPEIKNSNKLPFKLEGSIEFKNVSFTYPDSGITAIKNISFKILPGKSLAIIGKTGSGKSTIANLVCRFYDASEGEVRINNQSIKSLNLNSLRQQIGYVPQEVFLFSDTIYNNIGFSSPESSKSNQKELIEQAAKDAAIYSNIMEFPEAFDTFVGERGVTLSGGQKQRISIARAIVKAPEILIFDDCLSAVDTETEEDILNNLKRVMNKKTSITISHRVSSVKNSDHIIVIDHGHIVEEGNHEELMQGKGLYYELYQMQLMENEDRH